MRISFSTKRVPLYLVLTLSVGILSACQVKTTQIAPTLDPVFVPAFESTKPIAFRKIVLKVPRHQPLGAVSVGVLCVPRGEFTLSGGRHQLDTDKFNKPLMHDVPAKRTYSA